MRQAETTLLGEIEQSLTAGVGPEKDRRILALERLSKTSFGDSRRIVELLCDVIRGVGAVEPEITLIARCVKKAIRSDGSALGRLVGLVDERHAGAIQCAVRVLSSMSGAAQARLGCSLAKELFRRDSIDSLSTDIATTLKKLTDLGAKRAVSKEVTRFLASPDGFVIMYAVAILSRTGERDVERALVRVLGKLLDGYYGGHGDAIRKDLCLYFVRVRSRMSVPGLRRAIEKKLDRCFTNALASICETHRDLLASLLKTAARARDKSVKFEYLHALAAMRKNRARMQDFAGLIKSEDLTYVSPKASFKQMLKRSVQEARPILVEMLRSDDERRYEFALEVLKEMHIPIGDIADAIGWHPISLVYEQLSGHREELSIDALWRAKGKLGDNVGGKTTRLDYLMRNLLSFLGFVTIDVDVLGQAGVDVVAFPASWSYVLVIGATTGVVEDDVEKLANATDRLRVGLGERARKIEIIPIVATSLPGEANPKSAEYARRHGIVMLRQQDIDRLIDWANTNRSSAKFLDYLEGKIRERPVLGC